MKVEKFNLKRGTERNLHFFHFYFPLHTLQQSLTTIGVLLMYPILSNPPHDNDTLSNIVNIFKDFPNNTQHSRGFWNFTFFRFFSSFLYHSIILMLW